MTRLTSTATTARCSQGCEVLLHEPVKRFLSRLSEALGNVVMLWMQRVAYVLRDAGVHACEVLDLKPMNATGRR